MSRASKMKEPKIHREKDCARPCTLPDLTFLELPSRKAPRSKHVASTIANIHNVPSNRDDFDSTSTREQSQQATPSPHRIEPTPSNLVSPLFRTKDNITSLEALRQARTYFQGAEKKLKDRLVLAEEISTAFTELISHLDRFRTLESSRSNAENEAPVQVMRCSTPNLNTMCEPVQSTATKTARTQDNRKDKQAPNEPVIGIVPRSAANAFQRHEHVHDRPQTTATATHAKSQDTKVTRGPSVSSDEQISTLNQVQTLQQHSHPTTFSHIPNPTKSSINHYMNDVNQTAITDNRILSIQTCEKGSQCQEMNARSDLQSDLDALQRAADEWIVRVRVLRAKWNAGGRDMERWMGLRS